MRGRLLWLAALAIGAVSVTSSGHAQHLKNEHDGYIAAKLMLGFGGEGEIEADDLGGVGVDGEGDLEASYGIGAAFMQPLHEYFALGGQLSFLSWTSDLAEDLDFDRSTLLDLAIVPQAKYAVMDNLELYASLPLGLTFDFFGEDDWFGAEVEDGFGFNLALLLGVRVGLNDDFGLLGELGYAYHAFSHGTETAIGEGPDLEISLGQLALNVGGYFQL